MTDQDPALDEKYQEQIERAISRRRLEFYKPYPKQRQFHDGGGLPGIDCRVFMASNQSGKTMSAGAETAMHLTGLYPPDWKGHRFKTANDWWVASTTSQATRDAPQRMLMGRGEPNWGTGMIPGRLIRSIKKATHGVAESIEIVSITHEPTGKESSILFKSYDQGRLRWQGETIDGVWYDEEPPEDIYSEGTTRLQVKRGITIMTFTPLLGMTEVIKRFMKEKPPGSMIINMTLEDAEHFSPEQRKAMIAKWPEYEREARSKGIPSMGSGAVFPIDPASIMETSFPIPVFWPRLCGLDFGWDHPTAAAWVAWDRDSDVLHVYDCHRLREQTPVVHAAAINARGIWIPVAWPHDGHRHEGGKEMATQYRLAGVNMRPSHATHPTPPGKKEGSGGVGLEAGIMNMLDRMQTGRFKVASHLNDWFEEMRMYYRKDGLIVKEGDDLMSATRTAVMDLRFAIIQHPKRSAPKLATFQQFDAGMGVLG